VNCPSCQAQADKGDRFCGTCGAPIEERTIGVGQGGTVIRIGRDPASEFQLSQEIVSWNHAVLVQESGGRLFVEDMGSSNGTSLNHPGDRIHSRTRVKPEDVIFLGSMPLPVSKILGLKGPDKATALVQLPGSSGKEGILIGRDPECDVVLDQPMISKRHARIRLQGENHVVEDLGSTNGTFLNGERITKPVVFKASDRLSLGSVEICPDLTGKLKVKDYRGHITVEARGIAVDVPGKRLIEDMSLTLFPSEMVALMGLAGAGKTTLMKVLCGQTIPNEGHVFLNGQDLGAHFDAFRTQIGYVPQDDVMHAELTVFETLYFSAKLKLPSDTTEDELQNRVRSVIKSLELNGTENVLIGSADRKGVSGGQRKRVNIGIELLTDPPLLYLDEPTSGLSSEDAVTVTGVLRKLADEGKMIIATIHQPGLEVFQKFDTLVLLGKDYPGEDPGRLIYFGPAYPESIQHFNPETSSQGNMHPDDMLKGVRKLKSSHWVKAYRDSRWGREFQQNRMGKVVSTQGSTSSVPSSAKAPKGQWWTLVRRAALLKWRNKGWRYLSGIGAPLLVGLVLVGIFNGVYPSGKPYVAVTKMRTLSFFIPCVMVFLGGSLSLKDVVEEWTIFRRERMSNLSIPSYVFSKIAVLVLVATLQAIAITGVFWVGCGLKGSLAVYLGITCLLAICGGMIGLFISACVKTSDTGNQVFILALIGMLALGGMLLPYKTMNGFTKTLSDCTPIRWGFQALYAEEAREGANYRDRRTDLSVEGASSRDLEVPTSAVILASYSRDASAGGLPGVFPGPVENDKPGISIMVLIGMIVTLVCLVIATIVRRDPRNRAGGWS